MTPTAKTHTATTEHSPPPPHAADIGMHSQMQHPKICSHSLVSPHSPPPYPLSTHRNPNPPTERCFLPPPNTSFFWVCSRDVGPPNTHSIFHSRAHVQYSRCSAPPTWLNGLFTFYIPNSKTNVDGSGSSKSEPAANSSGNNAPAYATSTIRRCLSRLASAITFALRLYFATRGGTELSSLQGPYMRSYFPLCSYHILSILYVFELYHAHCNMLSIFSCFDAHSFDLTRFQASVCFFCFV